jgi:hypothetical protein
MNSNIIIFYLIQFIHKCNIYFFFHFSEFDNNIKINLYHILYNKREVIERKREKKIYFK